LSPQLDTRTLSKSTRVSVLGLVLPDQSPPKPGARGAPEVSVHSAIVHHSPPQSVNEQASGSLQAKRRTWARMLPQKKSIRSW
jgi:hypothetical protein